MITSMTKWFVPVFVLAITVLFVPSGRAQTTKVAPTNKSALESILSNSFGPALEAVTSFEPYYLNGDFNGDGAADVLIIVRIKGVRWAVPKDVSVIRPFYKEDPATPPQERGLGIAIIHGGPQGWQNSPAQKFLLFGESPILILENSRASSTARDDRKGLMELVKKRGKRTAIAMRPPAIAKGDSVSLPTEAADSVLYWNGKTYRWKESEGGE